MKSGDASRSAEPASKRYFSQGSPSHLRPDTVKHICLVAILWMLMAFAASADFSGKVVGVTDGDTVTVLDGRIQVKVRLSGIDAPEKAQPFGNRAKQALSNLVHGQEVRVVGNAKDRNGRTIGKIYRDNLDVNAEMVRLGMAWVFRRYASKGSPLFQVEEEARQAKRGLWIDATPTPPWQWRRPK